MFVTANQFYVFVACFSFGGAFGVVFNVSNIIKKPFNKISPIFDVLSFIFMGILFRIYSNLLQFPNFRAYMVVGVVLGVVAYKKSFYIILAKCLQKIYNKIEYKYVILKEKKKRKKTNDGTKVQKGNSRVNGRCSSTRFGFGFRHDVSNNISKHCKAKKGRARRTNS